MATVFGLFSLILLQMLAGGLTLLVITILQISMLENLLFLGAICCSIYPIHIFVGDRIINLAEICNLESAAEQLVANAVAPLVSMIRADLWSLIIKNPAQRWSCATRYCGDINSK